MSELTDKEKPRLVGQCLLFRVMIRVMESDWPREQRYDSFHLLFDLHNLLEYQSK